MSRIAYNNQRRHVASFPRSMLWVFAIVTLVSCQKQPARSHRPTTGNPESTNSTANQEQPPLASVDDASLLSRNTVSQWPAVFERADLFDDGLPNSLSEIYSPTKCRLLLLLKRSPLLIDVELFDDGESLAASWRDAAAVICRNSDSDDDGKTTWPELVSNEDLPFGRDEMKRRDDVAMVASAYDANGNDLVEPIELVRFINRNGGGQGFVTTLPGDQPADTRRDVFDWLDRNKNNTIDQSELQDCAARLTMRDANGDRLLSRTDFGMFNRSAMANTPRRTSRQRSEPETFVIASDDRMLQPTTNEWDLILYALEKRYAYGDPLTVGELPAAFTSLDSNEDGYIDAAELPQICELDPHAVLKIEFHTGKLPYASVDGGPTSIVKATRISRSRWNVIDDSIDLRLEVVDGLSGITSSLDAALSRLRLFVSLEAVSADLFSVLDQDESGLLDRVEMEATSKTLAGIDPNRDGQIEFGELSSSKALYLRRMAYTGNDVAVQANPTPIQAEPAGEPLWFIAMDSNRDRFVQASEFLGSTAQFDAYDANGDDRISQSEAAAATP